MHIHIIGAGIAGLTTAVALNQLGKKVSLYDQTTALLPIGSGIILASNAMQVYDFLGLRQEIEARGFHVARISVRKPDLSLLSLTNLKNFESSYGVKSIAIHRAQLQDILRKNIGQSIVHCGNYLERITENSDEMLLHFRHDSKTHKVVRSKIVIGADGIGSNVRKFVNTRARFRNADQMCWRGVSPFDLPKKWQGELVEIWGRGERFGFVQIAKGQVYWFALTPCFADQKKNYEEEMTGKALLERYFSHHSSLIHDILLQSGEATIHRGEIGDIAPHNIWYKKNICLVGDAAHATTPNLGQGACQAVEDSFILAKYLAAMKPALAFEAYQKARIRKAHYVVKASWTLGKMAHLSHPVLAGMRDITMKVTPDFITSHQMKRVFTL